MARCPRLILIVDDEERIRAMIGEHLEEKGFQTILASSGDDAIEHVRNFPLIDLIVTDVRMPGTLNGFDLVEQASASRPGIRTMIMSGYTDEAGNRAHVADRFLAKPFTMAILEGEVRTLLAA